MSRSFGDNLSKEDIRTIADVRREVWTAGFKGLAYGSVSGYLLHTASRILYNSLSEASRGRLRIPGSDKTIPIKFNRNTAFFSFMAGGALGSFVLATTTGKNQVHQMHEVFEIGKHEHKTPYQEVLERSRQEEQERGWSEDLESMKKRRLSRRKTVSKHLSEGHGLSDSHGGTWLKEDGMTSEQQQRRSTRRMTVAKRLEGGQGLSDSHGGKWKD
mmetsp:Transcript_13093/g.19082  ORF Transcript_13093/g.19082 Transcript_13093/m.19082 type:complete len:215 (-) Transcript_13093:85-729(-)|eukprot:CAMPEP_0197243418 /NCGR_PEP_ID=MMETSP1429-20130617/8877_1 /TAXON_ID=49237 /ORGANISM="Chaetoceros  sp., Strain UNC1202" /LENGTH=214 /DNA_ID=CAMNT_0042703641 /DNA_START=7 /DNA_END=651 /DNA_ORIENTATION=+